MEPFFEVRDIHKTYRTRSTQVKALSGITFSCNKGQTVAVLGESGSGKTTLGRIVLGLLKPDRGKVRVGDIEFGSNGNVIYGKIGAVFQDPWGALNPRLPVWKSIAEPLVISRGKSPRKFRETVHEVANQVGLSAGTISTYPHELSGGQTQRVVISRALITKPQLIVLDEPTSALDVSVQAQILNLLIEMKQKFGLTYLFITHDISLVKHIADYTVILLEGRCVEKGPSQQLLEKPEHGYTKRLIESMLQFS